MRNKRKNIQPAAPIPPANDKPLIRKEELERAEASLRPYMLTEDERLAIIEKYGPPTKPPNRITLTTSQGRVRPSFSHLNGQGV